ncbi:MAG: undecaprenyldiphospho-muramoylpentapeptide beta-N-acetylglucosaminyltransferase [Candidatus Omnitrophica bacterium]|nr:undecaprenyldiphospho-muramoylpentapeptide beta-N-acetylglucosaminyltransferase [Candidatus Omnitrophota bacterium]MBU4478001.1 undecaprenyldiphospho-muramoylpentapeptide beta-N-acetylglucosaminyltransferase [Candidatus Omnitrophota bacterium]MCG2703934.1 undecaprenyldiphospho-muramoylpentapeptide beta-N-acetylglucosaminyltransferase [Candidatus Omnitrophota bacterium]
MKIIICAAGSGGHIYPALRFAQELKASFKDVKIIFLCTKKNIEKAILKDTGYKTFYINLISPRSDYKRIIFFLKNIYFLLNFIVGNLKVFFVLCREKPQLVVGFGGIGAVPALIQSWMMRIPTIIHEQNVVPGLANRLLSRIATKVAVGFSESRPYFKRNDVEYTGTPLRGDLRLIAAPEAKAELGLEKTKFTMLVFGGSQGAEFINRAFIRSISGMAAALRDNLQVIHITGNKETALTEREYLSLGVKAKVVAYFNDMSKAYSAADIVISRAGAGTINEISWFGRPAILIPYPYAGGHQLINAQALAAKQAAYIVKQDDDCSGQLRDLIVRLAQDRTIEAMARKRKSGMDTAAASLARIARELLVR